MHLCMFYLMCGTLNLMCGTLNLMYRRSKLYILNAMYKCEKVSVYGGTDGWALS